MTDDERKATEDLLAGFDRPGRSPRAPRVQGNFIDFTGTATPPDARRAQKTALVTRSRRAAWLPWVAVVVVLAASAGAIAWAMARPTVEAVAPAVVTPVAPAVSVVASPRASEPAAPTVSTPPKAASATPPPRSSAVPRQDPRVDFVRNL